MKKLIVLHLVHLIVHKMLKSMKKWASYALWKWRGWFAKIEQNSLVYTFEFKIFVCSSISSDIQTNLVVFFLAHSMVQKLLKLMKNWASYALRIWRRWFAKIEHNNLVFFFDIKLLLHYSITFDIQKENLILLLANIIKKFSIW